LNRGEGTNGRSATRLVASCGARDLASLHADLARLRPEIDLVEIRADRLPPEDALTSDLATLRAAIDREAIFTLRARAELGESDASLEERKARHAAADAAGFDWLDLEEDVASALPRGRARRIVSWHGVLARDEIETALGSRITRLAGIDADVVKIACDVADPATALRLVRAAQAAGRAANIPVVAIAMGRYGRYLRPLASYFDMPLLYAALHPSRKTAAGQLGVDEALVLPGLARGYAKGRTALYAVIGGEVHGSASPLVHNATFAALGRDALYVDLAAPTFESAAEVLRELPLDGASVTSPFKREALALAATADDAAKAAASANTLVRTNGGFHALNTDAPGFLAAVELALRDPDLATEFALDHSSAALTALRFGELLPHRARLRSALVYGTGGVARGIASALRGRGVRVHVTGRDQGAAMALVLELGGGIEAISEGRAHSLSYDLLVKAVPDSKDGELALDPTDFAPGGFAADVVYRPLETSFLIASRRSGRVPIPGLLFFAAQAALQAAVWNGVDPSTALKHVASALA
jgi:3-dehydroquinate dehydratase/shikimate dehydrogenase